MAELLIGVRCCRSECAGKTPTLLTIEAPDNTLTKAEADATFERLVACSHCKHDNIITLPLKWGQIWLGGFKIVEYYTTGGRSIPVVQGRCPE